MTPEDRRRAGNRSERGSSTVPDVKPAPTETPPNSFAPVVRMDSIGRHFRAARERAACEAARLADTHSTADALGDEQARRTRQSKVEQAGVATAWHAAENEGWNTETAARPLRRPRSRPGKRRSDGPSCAR